MGTEKKGGKLQVEDEPGCGQDRGARLKPRPPSADTEEGKDTNCCSGSGESSWMPSHPVGCPWHGSLTPR